MLARVYSCAVVGLDGVIVEVEVDTGEGLPSMVMIDPPEAGKSLLARAMPGILPRMAIIEHWT
jgi:hypothetical protein